MTKLENVIKADHISRAIMSEMVDLTSRTKDRLKNVVRKLNSLDCQVKKLGAIWICYVWIWWSKYQFEYFDKCRFLNWWSSFNVNLLMKFKIFVGESKTQPLVLQHQFYQAMQSSSTQNEFEVLDRLVGDRVQRQRLQLLHKLSRIMCWVQFDRNVTLAESSQIIRDYIHYAPICKLHFPPHPSPQPFWSFFVKMHSFVGYHLTAYIRSWQNVMNNATSNEQGTNTSRFNTYIIFVLVTFFLQLNHKFPKSNDLPTSNSKVIDVVSSIDKKQFKQFVKEFFDFYATQYEIGEHIISLFAGRWQILSPEHKR